jgi:hypothetical protein
MEVAVGGANPDRLTAPTFGGPSGNYSLSLALHDDVSGASGSLTFRGNLNGLIEGDNSLSLTNRFFGSTTETLTLGGNLYTVMIGPFVPPRWSTWRWRHHRRLYRGEADNDRQFRPGAVQPGVGVPGPALARPGPPLPPPQGR